MNGVRESDRGRTFSCWMCFKSLSSRYVRLLRTGVLKGFMIFLIATEEPVSWSFAELGGWLGTVCCTFWRREDRPDESECACQGRLSAAEEGGDGLEKHTPIPTGCRSTYRVVTWKM